MYLIVIGCEYTGKTTLVTRLNEWLKEQMGESEFGDYMIHDHFIKPFHEGETEAARLEAEYVAGMPPTLLEKYSRYMIDYHFGFFKDDANILVNWYYADAVYAPLYYGFGGRGEYADRAMQVSWLDSKVMSMEPRTTLVLMKATPEAVRVRMQEARHPDCIVQDKDIEQILTRFEELYVGSSIRRKITLDTTDSTPESTFAEFLVKAESNFTDRQRLQMLAHKQVFRP